MKGWCINSKLQKCKENESNEKLRFVGKLKIAWWFRPKPLFVLICLSFELVTQGIVLCDHVVAHVVQRVSERNTSNQISLNACDWGQINSPVKLAEIVKSSLLTASRPTLHWAPSTAPSTAWLDAACWSLLLCGCCGPQHSFSEIIYL